MPTLSTPTLNIGLLGCSRIAERAIIPSAAQTGCRLIAVAARDRDRASAYARANGIEKVYTTYDQVLTDPDVDLVYNPLINSLHAPWNLQAITAGKPVLSEKPFANNASEAAAIKRASDAHGVFAMEAFHYYFHPVNLRMRELLSSGELGNLVHAEAVVKMNPPPRTDARWSFELGGGAMMDLGCYALHALRSIASCAGGAPQVVGAKAHVPESTPGVDESMAVDLVYPCQATASIEATMDHTEFHFTLRLVGTRGEAEAANFVLPQMDDRITVRVSGQPDRVERLGQTSSFTHQLRAIIAHLRQDAPHPLALEDAVANMALLDHVYTAAGLQPRPGHLPTQ